MILAELHTGVTVCLSVCSQ